MIPVLYPPNATDFSTLGLGVLTDTVSCEVTEERNGVFECIKHKIVGSSLGVNPIVTLMGLYFSLKFFGFRGMFLVPLCVMTL